jgi:hypothetical protein
MTPRMAPFILALALLPAFVTVPAQAEASLGAVAAGSGATHRVSLRDPGVNDVRYIYEEADYDRGEVVDRPAADVLAARVSHRHRTLFVRMRFSNLRRIGWQHYEALVTTPATRGDWFSAFVESDFADRSGSHVLWDGVGSGRVTCRNMRHDIDFGRDVVRLWIPRACLGNPRWVKVELNNDLATRASRADTSESPSGMQYRDNPFNARAWADTTTRRLYRAPR